MLINPIGSSSPSELTWYRYAIACSSGSSSSSKKRKAEFASPTSCGALSAYTPHHDDSTVVNEELKEVVVVAEEQDENSFINDFNKQEPSNQNSQSSIRSQQEEKEETVFLKYKTTTTQTDVHDKCLYPTFNKTLKKENLCAPYIGSQVKLYDLLILLHDHGRRCGGNINYLSRSWTQRGLALSIKFSCTLKDDCVLFTNHGKMEWLSSETMNYGDNKEYTISIPDAKFCIASILTQGNRRANEDLMRAMQFQPPNRNRQNNFNSFSVYPYILSKKKEIEDSFAHEMRKESGLSCSFDVGHNISCKLKIVFSPSS